MEKYFVKSVGTLRIHPLPLGHPKNSLFLVQRVSMAVASQKAAKSSFFQYIFLSV